MLTNDPEKLQIFIAEGDARLETIKGTDVPDKSKAGNRWYHVALNTLQSVEESIDVIIKRPLDLGTLCGHWSDAYKYKNLSKIKNKNKR